MRLRTTIPAGVARVARDHLRRLDRLLPGRVEGFYVVGSTALLAYREGVSDVDFVAVLDRRLDERELGRLRLAHVWASRVAVARAVTRRQWALPGTPNGSFVTAEDLTRPVTEIVPVASHTGAAFAVGEAFDVNPVVWQTFATWGLALRGPDSRTLGLDPEPAILADWNRANLDGYWRSWAEGILARPGPRWFRRRSSRWWTAWGVLGAPRLHHTIVTGDVISKEEAGEWAIHTYDAEWHEILWEAQDYRRGESPVAAFPDASTRLSRAAEFVLEVVRQAVDEPPPSMDSVDLGAPRVTEAVVAWSGWGTAAWPQQSRVLLVERFGEEAAKELSPIVRYLHDEYEVTDAVNVVPGLVEMGRRASSDFRARHPEVANEAVEALEWCYMFKHR